MILSGRVPRCLVRELLPAAKVHAPEPRAPPETPVFSISVSYFRIEYLEYVRPKKRKKRKVDGEAKSKSIKCDQKATAKCDWSQGTYDISVPLLRIFKCENSLSRRAERKEGTFIESNYFPIDFAWYLPIRDFLHDLVPSPPPWSREQECDYC